MILGDKYALFRDERTGEPFDEPELTQWDYVLINAVQIIEDYTMSNGLLAWDNDSDSVEVYAVQKVDKFESAKAKREKGKDSPPGTYYTPITRLSPFAKEWPTMRGWMDAQK